MELFEKNLFPRLSVENDPMVLIGYEFGLRRMANDPALSEKAALYRVAVRERLRRLREHAEPAVSVLADQLLRSRLSSRSVGEDAVLREGLEASLGRSVPRSLRQEPERRVELPAFPFRAGIPEGPSVEVRAPEDIVRVLLDRFHALESDSLGPLRLRPLDSRVGRSEFGHLPNGKGFPEPLGKGVAILKSRLNLGERSGNRSSREYLVTHRRERSTDFDKESFSVDLLWRGEAKIGTLTVDAVVKGEGNQPALQWEVQLLPQWRRLAESRSEEFSKFYGGIQGIFGGKPNPVPAHLRPPRVLPAGFRDPVSLHAASKPPSAPLRTKAMTASSLEDDRSLGVNYLMTERERERYRVYASDGRLYDALGIPLDTRNKKAIYVMDRDGNLYVDCEGSGEVGHHSSFFAGQPVAAAGQLEAMDGVIESIDNASGHYQPPREFLEQAVARLRELGVAVPDSAVHLAY